MHDRGPRRNVIVVGLAALALVMASCGDDDSGGATSTTDTTDRAVTTTTIAPAPATGIVWPVDGSVAYDDPVAAATRFALDFVGFVDPVVGNFLPAADRTGMVEVRPTPDGPVTAVYLGQVGAATSWSVLGAATGNIAPTEPEPRATVASPLQLRGSSTAPEGAVGVTVRDRSSGPPLAESYVTGGSMGELAPFEGTLDFNPPTTTDGSVTLFTESMEDGGGVWEATVVSVEFAP